MTSQQFLVCDSSTLANFKQWAQAISAFFGTAGWAQSADTGQVNWSTISSVPGSGAFVYEIWQPNDGLTTFYLKVQYGNNSGTNNPTIWISAGTSTNGAGTLTGFTTGVIQANSSTLTPPSTTTQYECDFSGAAGRIGVMMWRNAPANQGQELFTVERSVDSSGTYTGSYVTLCAGGGGSASGRAFQTQSLVFAVGPTPNISGSSTGGLITRAWMSGGGTSSSFNGSLAFDTHSPMVGYFDFPSTAIGVAQGIDLVEGVTFAVTLYGSSRTYMPSKIGNFASCGPGNAGNCAVCMRYD